MVSAHILIGVQSWTWITFSRSIYLYVQRSFLSSIVLEANLFVYLKSNICEVTGRTMTFARVSKVNLISHDTAYHEIDCVLTYMPCCS